ncbi:MAG: site-2 protease family protein [Chloroflexi bacterium]|nr:site-2 protease family protein [Chloroflexota bacterium]
MMRNSFSLGTIFGIELRADLSWLVAFGLVVWMLSAHDFPMNYSQLAPGATFGLAIATAIFFFASVVAHELGHSLVSARLGLPVPRITLFIFGGMAQLSREPQRPRDEFLIAIAGPLVSFALALGFGALAWAGPGVVGLPLTAFGRWLSTVNFALALFNLLPGFPLDGGRILRAIVWGLSRNFKAATALAGMAGRLIAFGLIGWGLLQAFRGNWADALWIAFVGWFIEQAASQSVARVALQDTLAGHTAREAMMTDCPRVGPAMTIQKLVDEVVLASGRRCFPVVGGNRVTGLITLNEIRAVPREEWATTTVGTAMIPLKELKSVSPEAGLIEVFEQMTEADVNQIPVVENGQLVGMVARDNILAFLQARAALGV